jgi:hypothetical protein
MHNGKLLDTSMYGLLPWKRRGLLHIFKGKRKSTNYDALKPFKKKHKIGRQELHISAPSCNHPGVLFLSILILILLEICLQTCMTYTIAECTVNNSR